MQFAAIRLIEHCLFFYAPEYYPIFCFIGLCKKNEMLNRPVVLQSKNSGTFPSGIDPSLLKVSILPSRVFARAE